MIIQALSYGQREILKNYLRSKYPSIPEEDLKSLICYGYFKGYIDKSLVEREEFLNYAAKFDWEKAYKKYRAIYKEGG